MTNDREAVAALVYAYAEHLDGGELDRLADLFTRATLRSNRNPAVRHGREQALALYRNTVALYDGIPCTKHVITNLVINLDGAAGTATARSYFTVLQARPELPLQVIIAGRYHDRFARTEGSWHFADRLILVDLVGDLRFHLQRGMSQSNT
jgi:3-phenylpropionate/cinnamic acid dioxygenase small subunit